MCPLPSPHQSRKPYDLVSAATAPTLIFHISVGTLLWARERLTTSLPEPELWIPLSQDSAQRTVRLYVHLFLPHYIWLLWAWTVAARFPIARAESAHSGYLVNTCWMSEPMNKWTNARMASRRKPWPGPGKVSLQICQEGWITEMGSDPPGKYCSQCGRGGLECSFASIGWWPNAGCQVGHIIHCTLVLNHWDPRMYRAPYF